MKFERRFFFSVIPEWKDQYIALEVLLKQIESIKNAAIRLVQSIANIKSASYLTDSHQPRVPYSNPFKRLELEGGQTVEVDLHAIRVRRFIPLSGNFRTNFTLHCMKRMPDTLIPSHCSRTSCSGKC